MITAAFCVWFGLSLFPKRKPACLRFAEKVSGGIMPEGAEEYCRKLTILWFFVLLALSVISFSAYFLHLHFLSFSSLIVVPLLLVAEKKYRDKRFTVTFHTSGSTGTPKTIVKTFESLAKEVAMHRDIYRKELDLNDLTMLSTIDPSHMYGTLWRVMLPKALKIPCDEEIILTPESLLAKMNAAKKVFLVTTPSFLERFTAYAEDYEVPRNVVEIVTSGAALSKKAEAETVKVFGITPKQIFGSTETGGVAWKRGGDTAYVFPPVKVSLTEGRLTVKSPFSYRNPYQMGDGAEIAADGRSFKLLGRKDRMVKINEERVDLVEMENKIRALGYKDAAVAKLEGKRGDTLGVVLVGEKKSTLELRKEMQFVFPKGTLPKKYRFVKELPRNSQGKVVMSEVIEILKEKIFNFTGEEYFFDGHFPGQPILPGVMQLQLAVERCEELLGKKIVLKEVKKMKFVQIIQPKEEIRLKTTFAKEGEMTYEFFRGETLCSSGVLVY